MVQGPLNRLTKPVEAIRTGNDPVDDDLNIVHLISIHLESGDQIEDDSIYTNFGIALFAGMVEEFSVMAFSPANQWGQDDQSFCR